MMKISDLAINRKLLLGFTCVIIAFMIAGGSVFSSLTRIEEASVQTSIGAVALEHVDSLTKSMLDLSGQVRGYLLTHDEAFAKGVESDKADVRNTLDELRLQIQRPEQQAGLDELDRTMAGYVTEAGDPEIRLGRDPATLDQALAIIKSGANKRWMNAFKAAATAFHDREMTTRKAHIVQRDQATAMGRWTVLAGVAGAIAVAGLMGWMLSRQIATPVVALTAAMRRIASGDDEARIPGVGRKDELGAMAGALQVFKDATVEKGRLEHEAVRAREAGDLARARHAVDQEARAAEQAQVVDGLARGLDRLSAGDLVFRVEAAFAQDYEKLRSDFNGAMSRLQETMRVVVGNTTAIRSGSAEIATAADDLSRRTEQQAASLEETAAALDEITATVRKTSDGATHARTVVAATRTGAEQSGEVMRQAVKAMAAIEASSHQIGQIIGVIDEIAFQTNLLALNAGVEAARAGDAGRGFAVVASEVRALAQRSAEAAKQIKALISASSRQVAEGVHLVDRTGKSLEQIVAQVGEMTDIIAEIAASTQEQATALQQVNTAINQMDQVTQQNAAMVEESTAASHSLTQETEDLARLIGTFRVGQDGTSTRAPQVARTAVERSRVPAAALRTGGRGGAALNPEPVAADESWTEF